MRRLPIFIVADVSESMINHLADVENGIGELISQLNMDPYALETTCLSLIVFAGKSKIIFPLTEVYKVNNSYSLPLGGGTSLGNALSCLMKEIDNNVQKNSPTSKGDWKPIVFLFTDGMPTDNYRSQVQFWKKNYSNKAHLVAISLGEQLDCSILGQLTDDIYLLKTMTASSFKEFFKWVTNSIKTNSVSVSANETNKIYLEEVSDDGPLKRINLKKDVVVKNVQDEFMYIMGKCSQRKKRFLLKYVKNKEGNQYQEVGIYQIPNEELYDELTEDVSIGQTFDTESIESYSDLSCPHCGNQTLFNLCSCGRIFCTDGESYELTCPWCGKTSDYSPADNLIIGSSLG